MLLKMNLIIFYLFVIKIQINLIINIKLIMKNELIYLCIKII